MPFKKISIFLNQKQKRYLWIYLFNQIIISFLEVISLGMVPLFIYYFQNPNLAQEKINRINEYLKIDYSSSNTNELIFALFIIFLIILIIKNFMNFISSYFEAFIVKIMNYHNLNRLFKYYVNEEIVEISKTKSAEILRNITSEVPRANGYIISMVNIVKESILLLSIFAVLLFNNFTISLISISVLILISFLIIGVFRNKLYKKGEENLKTKTNIIENINNSFGALKEIKLYKLESHYIDYLSKNLQLQLENEKFKYFITKINRNFFEIGIIFIIIVFLTSNKFFNLSLQDLLPYFGLLTVALIRSMPSFSLITSLLNSMKYTLPSFEKIHDEIKKFSLKEHSQNLDNDLKDKNFNEINVKNLNFSYDKKKILNNISFSIKKGDFIGLIGKTGTGKTTLANIILGLIKPDSALIYLDEKKADSINQNFSYGYVPQECFLVNGTIEENIALGFNKEMIDQKLMKQVLNVCELEEVKDEFYKREDTLNIGDRGAKLSGGQRQRIAIARSLYRKPKIIIFDESTNQIDPKTKFKIINNIKNTDTKLTIIFITHDTNLYKFFDKVINLDEN